MSVPNFRRVIRANRLLAELGHADILDALTELQALRAKSAADLQTVKDGLAEIVRALQPLPLTTPLGQQAGQANPS